MVNVIAMIEVGAGFPGDRRTFGGIGGRFGAPDVG